MRTIIPQTSTIFGRPLRATSLLGHPYKPSTSASLLGHLNSLHIPLSLRCEFLNRQVKILSVRVLGKVPRRDSGEVQLIDAFERDTLRLGVQVVPADGGDEAEPSEDVAGLAAQVAGVGVD